MSLPVPVSEYVKLSTASGSVVVTVPTAAPVARFSFTDAWSSDRLVGASFVSFTVMVKSFETVRPPESVEVT